MLEKARAKSLLLDPLLNVCRKPEGFGSVEAMLDAYGSVLANFDEAVLLKARDKLIAKCAGGSWPPLRELVAACLAELGVRKEVAAAPPEETRAEELQSRIRALRRNLAHYADAGPGSLAYDKLIPLWREWVARCENELRALGEGA